MPATAAPALEYIIEEILPAREVHIIGGPSGAGKTSLVYQLLIDPIRREEKIWGYQSHSVPMCYVSCDRSDAGIQRTLRRLKIDNPIPFINARAFSSAESIITKARETVPGVRLLFLEAIIRLIPEGKFNDYKIVSDYLVHLGHLCEKYDITLVCITHSPKSHEGERYLNPRQRLAGTVAWGAFTETVILIEPGEGDNERQLHLLPRNAEETSFTYAFEGGMLKEVSPEGIVYEAIDRHLLPCLKTGTDYSRIEIVELVGQVGIQKCSVKTIERWLKDKLRLGVIERPSKGVYRRAPIQ